MVTVRGTACRPCHQNCSITLKSNFPVFESRSDSQKSEKVTICFRVLNFLREDSVTWKLEATNNFRWCHVRSILKVVGKVSVTQPVWPVTVDLRDVLKCHWDQNFGIPYFCIFENSLWLLVTMPNFNSLRRLEVAFFGRFLSRFYGRHYWPLFRKLACELAKVTLEAHLKPNTFIRLLAARNLTVVEGRFPANCLLYDLEISLLQQL